MTGNEISLWIAGAKRTKSTAQIVEYAAQMAEMDADGHDFWLAVKAVAGRTK